MVDTLYPEAANLSNATFAENQKTAQGEAQQTGEAQRAAGSEAGAMSRQLQAQQAEQKLQQMKNAQETVLITPQLAMGLVRNTGDPEWLKSVGQKMRPDVYTALYTHGLKTKIAGKEYKAIHEGKEYTLAQDVDENGDLKPRIVSIGDAPVSKTGADTAKAQADRAARERSAREKASGGGSGSKLSGPDSEFMKTYRQAKKDTEGMNGMMLEQMAKKDPQRASELKKKLDFVEKEESRFNQIQNLHPEENVPQGTSTQKYASADEVRAAYKAGTLSRDDAKKVLSEQFGMK